MMVEGFETFIIKTIKQMHKDFAGVDDYIISIRYGKRISTKGETELLQEMQESKRAGMPSSYIAALHKDLIYAKYKNNTGELNRQLILLDLEPLAAYTTDELFKLEEYISKEDLFLKVNFDSIIAELEQKQPIQYFMPDADYGVRVAKIKTLIDEILQKRIGAFDFSAGSDVE